ncbi:unnamed protein product [Cylicocyclus nassatus]|uniref:Uncharacterized protein n=1 Tax=Cylicocyclus nassatus TaxID=53992 RepID=A0AA36GJ53_CYLNA|nr:unnamed protein product [Cylicocyclus nassatus]
MAKSKDKKEETSSSFKLETMNAGTDSSASLEPSKKVVSYSNLDPDKVVEAIGFGRYQLCGYLLCQGMNFFYSSAMYVMPYVGPDPVLQCIYENQTSLPMGGSCRILPKGNISLEGSCGVVKDTVLVIKDLPQSTTLIKDFNLICSSFVWKEAGLTAFTLDEGGPKVNKQDRVLKQRIRQKFRDLLLRTLREYWLTFFCWTETRITAQYWDPT